MDGGKLQQISTDHVFGGTAVGKAPLTQYLGLPEELQRLEDVYKRQAWKHPVSDYKLRSCA